MLVEELPARLEIGNQILERNEWSTAIDNELQLRKVSIWSEGLNPSFLTPASVGRSGNEQASISGRGAGTPKGEYSGQETFDLLTFRPAITEG